MNAFLIVYIILFSLSSFFTLVGIVGGIVDKDRDRVLFSLMFFLKSCIWPWYLIKLIYKILKWVIKGGEFPYSIPEYPDYLD